MLTQCAHGQRRTAHATSVCCVGDDSSTTHARALAECWRTGALPAPLQESLLNAITLKEAPKTRKDEDSALGVFLDDKKHLVVVITTDRGLCGSVNSSLSRALRKELTACAAAGSNVRLFVLGEKGRAQVARDYLPIVARSVDSYMDRDPIFPLAASIASKIIAHDYDVLTLWYNKYENQVKFTNVYKKIPKLTGLGAGVLPPSLKGYEVSACGCVRARKYLATMVVLSALYARRRSLPRATELNYILFPHATRAQSLFVLTCWSVVNLQLEPEGEETLANVEEYGVASALFYAMLETAACETSQRVTAMDNASTNAKDMVDRFKLIYNRARQAKITTELTEIISGSESLVSATVSD